MTCDKVEYTTYDAALAAARAINDRKNESQHPYKCQSCGMYHNHTRGKRHGIRNIYKPSSVTLQKVSRQAAPLPPPNKIIRPTTQRLISKEMAAHLKRLIEGNNEMQKQKI